MTTVNGTIAANRAAQWVNLDPTTATKTLTLANSSNDYLVFAYDGAPASNTHGVIVVPGAPLTFTVGATSGLTFPWGAISIWGPTRGQAFSVVAL